MGLHGRTRSQQRNRRGLEGEDTSNDPYRQKQKPPEPCFCPQCGAVFHEGRWQWSEKRADAAEHLCPACQRIRDRYPAGYVTLAGPFLSEHESEILSLVHNEEARAKAEHPLERIMEVSSEDGKTIITTTDTHLARRIGKALQNAWKGELEIKQAEDNYLVRVQWTR